MKKIFSIIGILTVIIFLLAAALSCAADKITASLGEEFTLPVGQKASIEGEGLTLKFEEVVTDSRCPKGVECVWAGEAQCQMLFTYAASPAEMVLIQTGSDATAMDYFLQYKISFKLEPYPQEGQQIAASDYYLVMTVTK